MSEGHIEPLYTEVQAARLMHLKPRSLRTEREAGRIGFKRVAGKVMYRESDLIAWQQEGVAPCQDRTGDRASFPSRSGDGSAPSTTFVGPKTADRIAVILDNQSCGSYLDYK